jgi:hypothetical protein
MSAPGLLRNHLIGWVQRPKGPSARTARLTRARRHLFLAASDTLRTALRISLTFGWSALVALAVLVRLTNYSPVAVVLFCVTVVAFIATAIVYVAAIAWRLVFTLIPEYLADPLTCADKLTNSDINALRVAAAPLWDNYAARNEVIGALYGNQEPLAQLVNLAQRHPSSPENALAVLDTIDIGSPLLPALATFSRDHLLGKGETTIQSPSIITTSFETLGTLGQVLSDLAHEEPALVLGLLAGASRSPALSRLSPSEALTEFAALAARVVQ